MSNPLYESELLHYNQNEKALFFLQSLVPELLEHITPEQLRGCLSRARQRYEKYRGPINKKPSTRKENQ